MPSPRQPWCIRNAKPFRAVVARKKLRALHTVYVYYEILHENRNQKLKPRRLSSGAATRRRFVGYRPTTMYQSVALDEECDGRLSRNADVS